VLAERDAALGEPYQTLEQQHETAEFGMWVFLATELMLFGGLFMGYTVYRIVYPAGFFQGSHMLDLIYAAPNTAVLLVSSLTMALAVRASQLGRNRALLTYLSVTAVLGILFMAIKLAEYAKHIQDGLLPGSGWTYAGPNAHAVEMFFIAYYLMTGLHAVHLTIGIGLVGVTALLAWRGRLFPPARHTPVEMVGLYWHFIDVIWTLLLPLLYLVR
jgi:cytochrome c oxidase subunit III